MPRTKTIPASIDTPFFEGVTPLWVGPQGAPIPEHYEPAVQSLANWVGRDWSKKESGFFLLRTILLGCCNDCSDHAWEEDVLRAQAKRLEFRHRQALITACKKFNRALNTAPFTNEKLTLVHSIIWGLGADLGNSVTNRQAIDNLSEAIGNFPKILEGSAKNPFRFGPIEYNNVPRSLPRKEVAIALYLADRVSMWRKDGFETKKTLDPHKPQLTKNLPWTAIAQFASPPGADADDFVNPENVQSRVISLSKRVIRLVPPQKT